MPCNCEQALALAQELKAKRALDEWVDVDERRSVSVFRHVVILSVAGREHRQPGSSTLDAINKAAHLILSDPDLQQFDQEEDDLPFR